MDNPAQTNTQATQVPQTTSTQPEQTQPTEKQIVDQLIKERDSYRSSNQQNRSDINDIYSAFMGRMDEVKKVPYFEPITIPKLRTEVAYIVPFIFSGNPEIEVEGVGEEDKFIAEIIEKILNFRLETIPQAYERIEAWVKQSAAFGTSIIKVNWRFETKDNGDGTKSPIKDEPELEVPHILDCFYNPILPEVPNQSSIIFRSVLSVEEVKENISYDYVDSMGQLNRDKVESGTLKSNPYDSTQGMSGDRIDIQKASNGTVEVYERITCDRIQTICFGKENLLLRDHSWDYGFLNAVKLVHEPNAIPNRFDGFGVGQNTLGIGKAIHSIVNQTKQNIALTNNPMFLAKKGANIDKKQLPSRPGGLIEADVDQGQPLQNSLQALQFPDIKQGAIEFMNKLDDEHKRASGANDLVQGSASNKTLGQDQMASTYSSNRFELIQRRFKQALADVAKILIDMELKNLQSPDASILRIFPLEMRQGVYELLISDDAKNAEYNIKIKGDTTLAKNKDVQIKQIIDAYTVFQAIIPPAQAIEWARKILELRGVGELDKLLPTQEMMQQLAQPQGMTQPIPQGMNVNQPSPMQ